jgi:hypothetical protein
MLEAQRGNRLFLLFPEKCFDKFHLLLYNLLSVCGVDSPNAKKGLLGLDGQKGDETMS